MYHTRNTLSNYENQELRNPSPEHIASGGVATLLHKSTIIKNYL